MREERAEREAATESCSKRRFVRGRALDLRSCRFDQLAVRNPGRTNGFASAAVETLGHLMHEAGTREIEPAFVDGFDQRDTAARTRRLDERF
jgi:hypothetical protein